MFGSDKELLGWYKTDTQKLFSLQPSQQDCADFLGRGYKIINGNRILKDLAGRSSS